ncbi:MAG: hypothetical protein RR839_01100 [Oscillospiraceae bacterium]
MYKFATKFFAVLTVISAALFIITKCMSKGFVFSKSSKNDKKEIVAANPNFLSGFFIKITSIAAPIWFFAKIKTIINDHHKANRHRKLITGMGIFVAISLLLGKRKKKKLKRA